MEEKKISLKNLYSIAYYGEKPFTKQHSIAEFFYVTTLAGMVEKNINKPQNICIADMLCYFLHQMGYDMQDFYNHLLIYFKDSNADALLFESFNKDELFEDFVSYNDYTLEKLGVNLQKCTHNTVDFYCGYAILLMGKKALAGMVNRVGLSQNPDKKRQYLEFIELLFNSEGTQKDIIKRITGFFQKEKISKEQIIDIRNQTFKYCDNELIDELTEAITNPEFEKVIKTKSQKIFEIKTISEKLHSLESRVIGQELALLKVKDSILAACAGFKDENQPISSFLLTGPTGVGKTETAKAVADSIFDGKLYVVDMSTFKNEIDVSRLIGGSPNYVGYNDPSSFCEFLKENPNSVILFDEIEKGHFGCHDLLMRILDEGEFINAKGEKISLKDTIIFCTTNFTQNVKNVAGFGGEITTEQKITTTGIGLKKELVGRFTDVIEYKQLDKTACKQIAETKFLKRAITIFEKNNEGKIKLVYDDSLLNKILEDANTNLFGARDLKKAIHKNFISVVSKYVTENDCIGKTLMITSEGVLEVKKAKKQKRSCKEMEL